MISRKERKVRSRQQRISPVDFLPRDLPKDRNSNEEKRKPNMFAAPHSFHFYSSHKRKEQGPRIIRCSRSERGRLHSTEPFVVVALLRNRVTAVVGVASVTRHAVVVSAELSSVSGLGVSSPAGAGQSVLKEVGHRLLVLNILKPKLKLRHVKFKHSKYIQ